MKILILAAFLTLPIISVKEYKQSPETKPYMIWIEPSELKGILRVHDNRGFGVMTDSEFILTVLIERMK